MENEDVVLWKGSVLPALTSRVEANSPVLQSRFFIPTEVVVGRYGVVGMLVVDSRPENRKVTYTDSEWQGVDHRFTQWDIENGEISTYDPVRRAHYLNTDRGFSIIRAFGLPSQVAGVFGYRSVFSWF
jgi:hypothetical protein